MATDGAHSSESIRPCDHEEKKETELVDLQPVVSIAVGQQEREYLAREMWGKYSD